MTLLFLLVAVLAARSPIRQKWLQVTETFKPVSLTAYYCCGVPRWLMAQCCGRCGTVTASPPSRRLEPPSTLDRSLAGSVREGRGRLAADDRRGLVDELVVLDGGHHEQGKVHPAGDVALEDGVTRVAAPHR